MKVILEMDLPMGKETIKTLKKLTLVNGETISGMVLDNKNSKIENEDTSDLLYLINIKEEANFMIKILFTKGNSELGFLRVKDWLNIKMVKFSKGLLRKIKGFLEDILFQTVLIMKVNLETICLMEMDNFTGLMV